MSKRIALFPGSFDPITVGHENIVKRVLPLFDEVIVGIGINTEKKYMFPLEQRETWIKKSFADSPKVKVITYSGLTVDVCLQNHAKFILRGLRTSADFEFERAIAQMNKGMEPDLETIFVISLPEHAAISSTIVRDIIKHGGDASGFVPAAIASDAAFKRK